MKATQRTSKFLRRFSAFTLLELLVSITVLTILLLMLGSMFDVFNKTYKRTTGAMQTFDDVRAITTNVGRDISAAMCRTNQGRYLNLKVEDSEDQVTLYFAAPDEYTGSTLNMTFVSHIAYVWRKNDHILSRAVQNTNIDPTDLLSTASSVKNDNANANRTRLSKMTLSYNSGSPYGWITDPKMKKAVEDSRLYPMLRNVYTFEVDCYDKPASQGGKSSKTWDDSKTLPSSVELKLGVADEDQVSAARGRPIDEKLLRNFVVSSPLLNHGFYDNTQY